MALVVAWKKNQAKPSWIRGIVEEYWQPRQPWQFWEYLDYSMTIIETLAEPDFTISARAGHRYLSDMDLTKRLWPC